MVARIRLTALMAPALFLLASCGLFDIFTYSKFPAALALTTAHVGLADFIDPDSAKGFTLSAVDAGGGTYVILTGKDPANGPKLFVMDGNLAMLNTFSATELQADFYGGRAVLDADTPQRIVIGRYRFTPTPTGLVPSSLHLSGESEPWMFAITDPNPVNNLNVGGIEVPDTGRNHFMFTVYSSDWSAISGSYDILIKDDPRTFSIHGIISDPDREEAVLILYEDESNSDYYIVIPWSYFSAPGGTALLTEFNDSYFTKTGMREDLIAYTQGGFIGFQNTSEDSRIGDFIRYGLDGNPLAFTPLHYDNLPDIQVACAAAGDFYYTFDRQTRTIAKIRKWWTQ